MKASMKALFVLGVLVQVLAAAALTAPLGRKRYWGFTAHEIVSQIAQANLTSRAEAEVTALVGSGGLESICTWADEIRGQSRYSWSSELHYVNPNDNPPSYCNFSYSRDCPNDHCVVGAVYNYSYQLTGEKPSPNREEALKFLTHFVQDIHNPVHVLGPPSIIGGNNIDVTFFGESWNLHSLWDSGIPEHTIDQLGSESRYLAEINAKIDGIWQYEIGQWLRCSDSTTAICPEEWAVECDELNCSNVMVGVYDGVTLGTEYYNANYEVVEKQLAKAGLRLAAVLNEAFD